jgi:hypothetical protein
MSDRPRAPTTALLNMVSADYELARFEGHPTDKYELELRSNAATAAFADALDAYVFSAILKAAGK